MIRVIFGEPEHKRQPDNHIPFGQAAALIIKSVADNALVALTDVGAGVSVTKNQTPFLLFTEAASSPQEFEMLLNFAKVVRMLQRWQLAREYTHRETVQYLAGQRPIPSLPQSRPKSGAEVATYMTGWLIGRTIPMPNRGPVGDQLAQLIRRHFNA